jgi:hypothetical protein
MRLNWKIKIMVRDNFLSLSTSPKRGAGGDESE